MDIERIKQLIDVVADERIGELSISGRGEHVHIVRVARGGRIANADDGPPAAGEATPSSTALTETVPPARSAQTPTAFTAPMAGTFYRAASRDGQPLVQPGSVVAVGTPLCVIEAMKIMNEVESDRAGTVKRVLHDGGQSVERGQALFEIE